MKKTFKTFALASVLGILAVGCQKEDIVLTGNTTTEIAATQTVGYSVNGVYGESSIDDNFDWDAFLDRMMALAREGYNIVIFSGNHSAGASTKDVVTFTTTDEDEAKAWAKDMMNQGYDVQITYDDKTGIWTCIAIK